MTLEIKEKSQQGFFGGLLTFSLPMERKSIYGLSSCRLVRKLKDLVFLPLVWKRPIIEWTEENWIRFRCRLAIREIEKQIDELKNKVRYTSDSQYN